MECQLKYYGLKPYILAVPNLGDFFTSKLQNYKSKKLNLDVVKNSEYVINNNNSLPNAVKSLLSAENNGTSDYNLDKSLYRGNYKLELFSLFCAFERGL